MIRKSELTKELYNPNETAKYLGIAVTTLYKWGNENVIAYKTMTKNNRPTKRLYTKEVLIDKLNEFGLLFDDTNVRQDVIYARVSTHKQKVSGDLNRQIDKLKLFAIDKNVNNLLVISDIGSGLNDNRKGLNKLIELILSGQVNRIFISYKDRLTRFGFNYIKQLCDFNNTEIVIVSSEENDKSLDVELSEDIISIVHSFSGKLYGMRSELRKAVNKELTDETTVN